MQFIPTFESVQEEAISKPFQVTYGKTPTNIFAPEYLAAELLRSGRRKDHARVIDPLEGDHVDMRLLRQIINRHGLGGKWKTFAKQFELEE